MERSSTSKCKTKQWIPSAKLKNKSGLVGEGKGNEYIHTPFTVIKIEKGHFEVWHLHWNVKC